MAQPSRSATLKVYLESTFATHSRHHSDTMTTTLCAHCLTADSSFEIRKRRLCTDCFVRYVNSKVRKRMESYRFKNWSADQKKRLMLPLSGGVSSLCLLQVLDAQLREQIGRQNRTAYELVVVHVDADGLENEGGDRDGEWYEGVAERFELHRFLSVVKIYEAFEIDESLESDLSHLGLTRRSGHDDKAFYRGMWTSTKSVTTRSDLRELLMRRVLVALAKKHDCEGILWGHSDSKLAAQVLADVAKGRGSSVPGAMADGPSSEGLNFNYPTRDLFKAELDLYASVLSPPLTSLDSLAAPQLIASIRNTSIDALLGNYITSQGEKYPSIMANVVRTASKLQVPASTDSAARCPVCQSAPGMEGQSICYGCVRMKQDIKTQE
jgi:cytoplasmic tRNA 2-thiolation protein 2